MTDPSSSPSPLYDLPSDARPAFPPRRSRARGLVLAAAALIGLGGVLGVGAICVFLWQAQRTPREWAPYLQRRALNHRPMITEAASVVANWLIRADRLAPAKALVLPPSIGASRQRSGPAPAGSRQTVDSIGALRAAMTTANPGDVIELKPGLYHVEYPAIRFTRPGSAASPITLRAARLGEVTIESNTTETFDVVAPFWHVENLVIRGICVDHDGCEHAIHVAGPATDIMIRNNQFADFNAHIKINGENGNWPDRGIIEGNSFTDTTPRMTQNPVTPIDLVGASDWRVSGNIITDFARGTEGGATYGGFFKGAGQNNVFERNVVICAWKLTGSGERVGLSLGGGSTDVPFRREQGRTGLEQLGGVIRDNLIAFCSDDGIYLNRAARSVIDHNTLLDTAGIDARFVESSALATANIVDGAMRERDGGELRGWDNLYPPLLGLFVGLHPQRGLFGDPAALDLSWRRPAGTVAADQDRPDLCGLPRPPRATPGAFQDYGACLARR